MDYATLNKLPAHTFLDWEKFKTNYAIEQNEEYTLKRYNEALKISQEAQEVFISASGTWGADLKNGGLLSSYEGIGYHAGSAWMLKGFLDGPASIVVYRDNQQFKIK